MKIERIITLALCVFLWPLAMFGQTITGAITGTVMDETGAVVPNARITATNTQTNVVNTTVTNESGVYNFPFLPLGEYTVAAEQQGFKRAVLGPFRLEVNQVARVDVKMELGQVTESVEITAVAPVLQTEATLTGGTLNSNSITALPLNGRNFASLTLLVPGAISTNPNAMNTSARFQGGGSRPYVNGNREQTNNFLLDGIDVNDSIDNRIGYNPNVDALEEVRVLTGNAPAEFGNAAGAIVNATIKSGTNNFHGNLFHFFRNDNLDANGFFANRSGAERREFKRNIFGGTLGGPIVRNKLFFFMDYEGTRQQDSGPALATVPPAEFRTGNLSRFPNAIRDPLTGEPFPGNIIPQNRIVNPVALALFNNPQLYPLPNNPGTGAIGLINNYLGSSANFLNNDQADAKIDYQFTDNDRLSGRFSIGRYRTGGAQTVLPTLLVGGTEGPTTTSVVTWTKTFSPTVVNELRAGYSRIVISDVVTDPSGILGANGNQLLGIPGGQPIAGASSVVLGEGLTNVGNAGTISDTVDNKYQIGNNLTIARGTHFFRMGGQAIRFHQNRFYAGNNGVLGTFSYTGRYTGNAFADFLLDELSSKGRGSLTGKWGHRHTRAALFFQDDWKVAPTVTLNLGLRWEYTQPLYEVADRQSNFDLRTGEQLFAGVNGNSRALYEPYYKQFMPRVGFAWQARSRFVVRAGYGITSFMEGTGANLRLPLNPPFFFESDVQYDLTNPGSITTGFTDVQPRSEASGQVRAWNPNLRPQFTQQWNFTLEQQLSDTFSITEAYVGQKATHLVAPREFNQPLPGTGPVSTWAPLDQRRPLYPFNPLITNISGTDSSAIMNYHALQISGRKRMSHGLQFVTSYTYGKTLTDNLGYYGSGGTAGEGAYWQNAYDRRGNYGPSFYDARHNFSFGGNWDVPVGQARTWGQDMHPVANAILGGWSTSFMIQAHTGFPVTILAQDLTRQAVRGNVRADAYRELEITGQSIDAWFGNPAAIICTTPGVDNGACAYGQPAEGMFGNAGIGTERMPHFFNFDASIGKQFRVDESKYFDFRAEFFNVMNYVSLGPPNRSIASPTTFGQITSQVNSPRNIQFGLKFYF
jgi:hypothetical protein